MFFRPEYPWNMAYKKYWIADTIWPYLSLKMSQTLITSFYPVRKASSQEEKLKQNPSHGKVVTVQMSFVDEGSFQPQTLSFRREPKVKYDKNTTNMSAQMGPVELTDFDHSITLSLHHSIAYRQ